MNFLFIQIIGFVGLFFIILSFQKDKRSFTLAAQMISSFFFMTHYFLLHAWTGSAMNIVSGIRAFTFNKKASIMWLNKKSTIYIFIGLFWIATFFSWQGYISLLPAYSMTMESIALWNDNTKKMRWIFLLSRPGWILYVILSGSYAGMATEIFIVISLLTAIIRFDFLKKTKKMKK